MSSSPSSGTYPSIPASDLENRLGKVGLGLDNTVFFPVKVISRPLWLGKHEAIALELPHPLPDVFARRREHLLKLGEKDQEKCAAICPEPSGYYVMEFSGEGFTVSVLSLKEFKKWGFTEVPTNDEAAQRCTENQLLGLCLTVTGTRRYRSTAFNCQSWTAAVTASLLIQALAIAAASAAVVIAENEITTLHAQVSALKDAKDIVDRENVALKKESEDEIATLKSALQAVQSEAAVLKDTTDIAEGDSAAMRAALETAQSEVAAVKANTQTEIADAKRELVGVQAANDFLERELTSRKDTEQSKEREIQQLKDAANSNQRELQQALIAKAVAENAAQTAQTTAASLQAELERVRADKNTAEVAAAVAADRLSLSTGSGSLASWVHGVPSAARHAVVDAAESTTPSSTATNLPDQ